MAGSGDAWLARFDGRGDRLYLECSPVGGQAQLADIDGLRVVFGGILHDRVSLVAKLGERVDRSASDAELAARAFRLWGDAATDYLRGTCAVLAWDAAHQRLLCVRDRLGTYPLFYARSAGAWLFSSSIEALLDQPDVSRGLNRGLLVEYLTRRWLSPEETCFAAVRRIPPGHVLRIGRTEESMRRYWEPLPASDAIDWIPDCDAQDRFEAELERAVARSRGSSRAGILLSGGLDSSTVATVATAQCRSSREELPCAFSLTLPAPYDDDASGRRVATDLGLDHLCIPYQESVGPGGVLAACLDLSRQLPAPLFNVGAPAFLHLSASARELGCRVLLTGDGGDEWIGASPLLAANMLRAANLPGILGLSRVLGRSYRSVRWASLYGVLWQYWVRSALRDAYRLGMNALHGTRNDGIPPWAPPERWIAPDSALRDELLERARARVPADQPRPTLEAAYRQTARSTIDSAHLGLRTEESFRLGQRTGVRQSDPFWDPDLIGTVLRIHPRVRNRGGYSKALVRERLSRQFPLRGFAEQRKSPSRLVFIRRAIQAAAPAAGRELGTRWTLGELGIIDTREALAFLENPQPSKGWRAWDLLNLETWARARHRAC